MDEVHYCRTKTTEYYDALTVMNQARQTLASLTGMDLQSPESKELAEQATREYELAAASLDNWEIDAAKLHAERSRQLADQAFQAETRYQEQQEVLRWCGCHRVWPRARDREARGGRIARRGARVLPGGSTARAGV